MSVKTFSEHIVVVFRLVVSGKRFSTHGRVRENREIREKAEMRDECRGNRKTWRWKHSGVSVKTFSAHVVIVLRPVVSGKRFITHGRVRENSKIGEKTE